MTRTQRTLVCALGLAVASVAAFTVWLFWIHDPRESLEIGDLVGGDPWSREMVPGAREATDQFCDAKLPCVEALTSRTLTMYRFAERDQAAAAAERFGEHGYLTGWIAVRYEPGGLTPAQRADFERRVGCVDASVTDDGVEC